MMWTNAKPVGTLEYFQEAVSIAAAVRFEASLETYSELVALWAQRSSTSDRVGLLKGGVWVKTIMLGSVM